ncbi:hypothetical protein Tco_1404401 [Tanacetum coccineum]
MSSNTPEYIYPIIVPSDSDVEDAFSSTTTPNYTPASPDYSPASSGNTSPDPSDDLSKYLLASLAISPFHDDPYMKVMQAYNATSNGSPIPPQALIAPQTVLPPSLVLPLSPIMAPKRTSTSAAPAMTQAVIGQLVVDNIAAALKIFIGGLPHSIKGTVTASKPQTLEEAITITQSLMDRVTKHNYVQGTNDHK